jgi:hypothetical protein
MSWDVPANAGFLCNKAALLGATINETLFDTKFAKM